MAGEWAREGGGWGICGLDRQFVDFKTVPNGTQRAGLGLPDCCNATCGRLAARHRQIAATIDDRRRHTHIKSACKLIAKKREGEKERRKAKTENEN